MFSRSLFVATAAALDLLTEVSSSMIPPSESLSKNIRSRRETQNETVTQANYEPANTPIDGYKEGPHPIVSDSLFSLIIFIYVSITFSYMFYAFCWRGTETKPPPPEGDKDLPMITEMLNEVDNQTKEENAAV